MKRILYMVFTIVLLLSLVGCSGEQKDLVEDLSTDENNLEAMRVEEIEYLRQQVAGLEAQIEELEQQIEVLERRLTEAESADQNVTVVNPVREVTPEEMVESTGISLKVPDDAMDVIYYVIAGESPIAQAVFTVNEKEYCLRACATAEFEPVDISGLYYDWEVVEDVEVGYCAGKVYLTGETGYISWLDIAPGINYNLTMKEGATKEGLVEMANSLFVEVQGDL